MKESVQELKPQPSRLLGLMVRFVGLAGVITAMDGAWYLIEMWSVLKDGKPDDSAVRTSVIWMSLAGSVCLLILVYGCVPFVLGKTRNWWAILLATGLESVFFISIACVWHRPETAIANAIVSGSGLGMGWLVAQGVILYPVWGGVSAWWLNRRLSRACGS